MNLDKFDDAISEIPEGISPKENPFFHKGKWYWFDETSMISEPYDTKEEATKVLKGYVDQLQKEIDKNSEDYLKGKF